MSPPKGKRVSPLKIPVGEEGQKGKARSLRLSLHEVMHSNFHVKGQDLILPPVWKCSIHKAKMLLLVNPAPAYICS